MGFRLSQPFRWSLSTPGKGGGPSGYVGRTFAGNSSSLFKIGPVEPANLMAGAEQITMVARIRPAAGSSGNRTALGIDIGGATGPTIGLAAGNVMRVGARSQVADGFQSKTGLTALAADTWHSIVTVINIAAKTIDIYSNGVLDTNGSNTVTFGASAYTPGTTFSSGSKIGNNPPSSEAWAGGLADIAVFTRALVADEIAAFAAGTRPVDLSGGDPIIYFPLSEQTDAAGAFVKSEIGGLEGVPVTAPPASASAKPAGLKPLVRAVERRFRATRTLRLSAASAAALGDGSGVDSVTMRGGSTATQATAGNRPVYKNGGFIRFAAASSQWLSARVGKVDIKRGITIVTLIDARADGRVFSLGSSASDDLTGAISLSPVNGLMVAGASGNCSGAFGDYTPGTTGKAIISGRFSGVEVANWLNGVRRNAPTVSGGTKRSNGDIRVTTPPTTLTTQTLEIGRRIGSTNLYCDFDYYDGVVIIGNLTDEEVAYYEGVIAWANSAVNLLPVGHPWKNQAPTAISDIAYPWGNAMVARSPLPATSFVGSPCVIKGSDGLFYAVHDYFNSALDNTGRLLVSRDGKEWSALAGFAAYQWGTLWEHTDGNLYILALTRYYGDLQIGKSIDRGRNWTWTILSTTGGPLAAAGAGQTAPNYHRAGGVTHTYFDGYIFFGFENNEPGSSPSGFKSGVLYIRANDDLTDRTKWMATSQLAIGATGYSGADVGMLEGNVVVDDLGHLYNVLRLGYTIDGPNHAVFLPLTWDGSILTMPTWSSSFVKSLPGGNVKFQLIKSSGYLWAVTNENVALAGGVGGNSTDERDRVTLVRGQHADLSAPTFATVATVINQAALSNGLSASDQTLYSGFQYASVTPDGAQLLALYRVGWSGPDTYHNSNFIGAGRLEKPA